MALASLEDRTPRCELLRTLKAHSARDALSRTSVDAISECRDRGPGR
jgi:hypothetical protein